MERAGIGGKDILGQARKAIKLALERRATGLDNGDGLLRGEEE